MLVDQPKRGERMTKQKREQIIDAAYHVMSDKGYENASIKDIAHAAGITPGLVHYYFRNKEEILLGVLTAASNQYTLDMQQLLAAVPSEELANAALNEPKERVERQPEWYKLRYELFALGLRNPNLSQSVNALLENARCGIAAVLQKVYGSSKEDTARVAAILLACFDGLALQKMLDPEFDLDRTYSVLGEMAKAFMNTPE
jgi:AcrR family transcriptional regulator